MSFTPAAGSYPATRRILAFVLAAYLVLGAGFAARTPAWQAPDEPAHYNYIAHVATDGCCPVIEAGDWDSAYINQLTSARFRADLLGDLAALEYEDHQPPLYYLIQAPVFALTNGSLLALRLVSVAIGAGVVLAAFAVGRALLPERPQIALGAAAFVAFLPQHAAVLASVNNDGFSELVIGVTLWLMVTYLKQGAVPPWLLGLLAGIGLITKVNTLFLAGLVPLAILLRWWFGPTRNLVALARALLWFAVPALVLAGVWWARNVSVYGMPDIFGLGAHNLVVADQPRTAHLIAQVGWSEYFARALRDTFNSFWGQFGWMALPLPGWAYALVYFLLAVVALGLVVDIALLRPPAAAPSGQRLSWLVLGLTVLLAVLQYIYYNTEFWQFQGRYLYPALIPVAIWMAVGIDSWRRVLFARRLPSGLLRWLPVAALSPLALLDLYVLWRVLPQLAP